MPVKIYLDTSCLNAKGKHPTLNELFELAKEGQVTLHTTSMHESEQRLTNPNEEWRTRYIEAANRHTRSPGSGTIDTIIIGDFMVGDDAKWDVVVDILGPPTKKPNDELDASHLASAAMLGVGFFLTLNTRDFMEGGRGERIEAELGIRVRVPNDATLAEIRETINKNEAV